MFTKSNYLLNRALLNRGLGVFFFRNIMAKILCGKEASAELRKNLQLEVSSYGPNFKPGLTIVQVYCCKNSFKNLVYLLFKKFKANNEADSNVYIRMKMKAAAEIGINANHLKLDT